MLQLKYIKHDSYINDACIPAKLECMLMILSIVYVCVVHTKCCVAIDQKFDLTYT